MFCFTCLECGIKLNRCSRGNSPVVGACAEDVGRAALLPLAAGAAPVLHVFLAIGSILNAGRQQSRSLRLRNRGASHLQEQHRSAARKDIHRAQGRRRGERGTSQTRPDKLHKQVSRIQLLCVTWFWCLGYPSNTVLFLCCWFIATPNGSPNGQPELGCWTTPPAASASHRTGTGGSLPRGAEMDRGEWIQPIWIWRQRTVLRTHLSVFHMSSLFDGLLFDVAYVAPSLRVDSNWRNVKGVA